MNTGASNHNWRGGRSIASNGYVLIRVGVEHHLADVRGYAYEHRFHEALPFVDIDRVFDVMQEAREHTFQVLTKRPARMLEFMGWRAEDSMARCPLLNVWLGTSVEDQATADERIPLLLQTPAAVRFVSYEPALEDIGPLQDWLLGECGACGRRAGFKYRGPCECGGEVAGLDWVIVGAESGPGARPFDPNWARAVRDQCQAAGVAFFYKQDAIRGRKISTPELDGRRWVEFPA